MPRSQHCERVSLGRLEETLKQIKELSKHTSISSAPLKMYSFTPYDYMFKNLQSDPSALLDSSPEARTVEGLKKLGDQMSEPGTDEERESNIPAAYTYFGQFVDHDITMELQSDEIANLDDAELSPLGLGQVLDNIKNRRSPTLDLDSVYGVTSEGEQIPRNCSRLTVGTVAFASDTKVLPGSRTKIDGVRPPNTDINNDVPRSIATPDNPDTDREALIGDARNDENLIVSQMHVAFLRAHNAIVGQGMSFNQAKRTLVQHYQWLIIDDYLRRIARNEIIDEILTYGNRFFRPSMCRLFMPLEFSAGAFRFGHSMVRPSYDYNVNFRGENAATLFDLFSIPRFFGLDPSVGRIPEQWIIEWKNFVGSNGNFARKIDTLLVDPLASLVDKSGDTLTGVKKNLAVRNLLRGYLLRIPTGQSVAAACGFTPMSKEEILDVSTAAQRKVLEEFKLHERTPLWYYILAEASQNGVLGEVGSTIVAEVLIGLIRWSEDSILSEPNWKPTLPPTPGVFKLRHLFQLAGVWT